MLYHFNIIEGASQIVDLDGTELPSEEAAQAEACQIVSKLMREFPGRFGIGSAVEVFTSGRRIMAIPVNEGWQTERLAG